jgi:integrase
MLRACKAAGLEDVSFHELRHTYASALVNNKCPLPVVAQQLGHTDSRMVERHYGHLVPGYVADMVRAAMPTLGIVEPAKVQKLRIGGA